MRVFCRDDIDLFAAATGVVHRADQVVGPVWLGEHRIGLEATAGECTSPEHWRSTRRLDVHV